MGIINRFYYAKYFEVRFIVHSLMYDCFIKDKGVYKMRSFKKIIKDFFKFDLIGSIFTGDFFAKSEIDDEEDEFKNLFFLSDKSAIVIAQK